MTFFGLGLIAFAAPVWAHGPHGDHSLEGLDMGVAIASPARVPLGVLDGPATAYCDVDDPHTHERAMAPMGSGPRPFEPISCSTLVAGAPPATWPWPSGEPWFPVCTPLALQARRAGGSGESLGSPGNLSSYVTYQRGRDLCAPGNSAPRGAEGYVPASAASISAQPASTSERGEVEGRVRGLIEQMSGSCCNTGLGLRDRMCRRMIMNVSVTWCEPPTDPHAPDPCTDGAKYILGEPTSTQWRNHAVERRSPRRWPMASGSILLPPYVFGPARKLDSSLADDVLRHEIAHACSYIRRQVEIRRGNARVMESLRQSFYPGTRCRISEETSDAYQQLYSALRIGPRAERCMAEVARGADRLRFVDGPCAKGCPRKFLEEGYAELMRIRTTPTERWVPEVIPGACRYVKDLSHPLGADVMRCAFESPSFQDRIREATGCEGGSGGEPTS
ncbi:MAG: hypothetical protein IT285_03105 [Bdellovibrionales bacterium]|nr:hypothetical protein [Bdellovibrionales bacterium]